MRTWLWLLVGLVLLWFLWTPVRSLHSGTIKHRSQVYERNRHPVRYWFFTGLALLGVVMLLWLVLHVVRFD